MFEKDRIHETSNQPKAETKNDLFRENPPDVTREGKVTQWRRHTSG